MFLRSKTFIYWLSLNSLKMVNRKFNTQSVNTLIMRYDRFHYQGWQISERDRTLLTLQEHEFRFTFHITLSIVPNLMKMFTKIRSYPYVLLVLHCFVCCWLIFHQILLTSYKSVIRWNYMIETGVTWLSRATCYLFI